MTSLYWRQYDILWAWTEIYNLDPSTIMEELATRDMLPEQVCEFLATEFLSNFPTPEDREPFRRATICSLPTAADVALLDVAKSAHWYPPTEATTLPDCDLTPDHFPSHIQLVMSWAECVRLDASRPSRRAGMFAIPLHRKPQKDTVKDKSSASSATTSMQPTAARATKGIKGLKETPGSSGEGLSEEVRQSASGTDVTDQGVPQVEESVDLEVTDPVARKVYGHALQDNVTADETTMCKTATQTEAAVPTVPLKKKDKRSKFQRLLQPEKEAIYPLLDRYATPHEQWKSNVELIAIARRYTRPLPPANGVEYNMPAGYQKHRAAPYAFDYRGKLYKEWWPLRHICDEGGDRIMTEKEIKSWCPKIKPDQDTIDRQLDIFNAEWRPEALAQACAAKMAGSKSALNLEEVDTKTSVSVRSSEDHEAEVRNVAASTMAPGRGVESGKEKREWSKQETAKETVKLTAKYAARLEAQSHQVATLQGELVMVKAELGLHNIPHTPTEFTMRLDTDDRFTVAEKEQLSNLLAKAAKADTLIPLLQDQVTALQFQLQQKTAVVSDDQDLDSDAAALESSDHKHKTDHEATGRVESHASDMDVSGVGNLPTSAATVPLPTTSSLSNLATPSVTSIAAADPREITTSYSPDGQPTKRRRLMPFGHKDSDDVPHDTIPDMMLVAGSHATAKEA